MFFFSAGGPYWLNLIVLAAFVIASIAIFRGFSGSRRRLTTWNCGGASERFRGSASATTSSGGRTCINPLCRHLNRHAARFCSQCGQRLE